jgi:hypothetical protein
VSVLKAVWESWVIGLLRGGGVEGKVREDVE